MCEAVYARLSLLAGPTRFVTLTSCCNDCEVCKLRKVQSDGVSTHICLPSQDLHAAHVTVRESCSSMQISIAIFIRLLCNITIQLLLRLLRCLHVEILSYSILPRTHQHEVQQMLRALICQ